jgi:hypothetical protein
MTGFYKDYADSSDTHQNSAEASADAAEQSATEAATSASEAAASAAAALVSENNASTSESNASTSASNASDSEVAALASQSSASASATSASADADDAEDSATEAAASALAASNSATTAQNLEVTSASFDTADGTLTLTKANSGTVTTDLDGRYLTTHQDITGKADLSGAMFTGDISAPNIGIGISTPHSHLTIHKDNSEYRVTQDTFVQNGTFVYSYNPDTSTYGTILTRASDHRWMIGSDEKMRIDDTGYVGINNNNPSEALDVTGNSVVSGDATVGGELTVSGSAEAELFKGDIEGAVHFKGAVASGATLTKGDVVYVSGYSGGKTVVGLADASDSSKMPAFGIVAADPVGVNVDVVTFGTLKSIDTSSYTDGDELYVSTTAGQLTATAPSGEGNLVQKIAKVVRAHTSGNIKVMGAGRTNATPNLNDGNIFIGDSNNLATTASFATQVASAETSHADVVVDGDFTTAGIMTTDGSGGYSVDSSTYATETYVDTAVSGLVDSAPATLDTLNELASALGDDANFSTTVTNSIATKWTEDATKISNWNDAYSWGDHDAVGYLTAEVNDLETTVTWANVPDANITESSVTQHLTATNVANAGALMDSEVTNLAQVKAFDSSDYATATQGSTADSALQNLVEDTTPHLGGQLNGNSNSITNIGSITASTGTFSTVTGAIVTTSGNIEATGGNITAGGNIVVGGTVDGVDIATRDAVLTSTTTTANSAYGWGNHADANYLTTHQDITGKADLSGATFTGSVTISDDDELIFGGSNDLKISHSSSTNSSTIREGGTGSLLIQGENLFLTDTSSSKYLFGISGGATSLYYNGIEKLATSNTGISVQGNISATGTVDGVDIATRDGILSTTTTTANSAMQDLVDDTTPQLGGNLDLNGKFVTGAGTISTSSGIGTTNGNVGTTTGNIYASSGHVEAREAEIGSGKTGSFDDNYSTGINSSGSSTKVVDIGTGYVNGGTTTINIAPTAPTTTKTINLNAHTNVAGNIAVTGTVDGRDVATDGARLDTIPYHRVKHTQLRADNQPLSLGTAYSHVGLYDNIVHPATPVECARYLDLDIAIKWYYVSSNTNDLYLQLQMTVPTGGGTVTNMGTATRANTNNPEYNSYTNFAWYYVSGDYTHLFTEFGRINITGNSSSSEGIITAWKYDSVNNRTYLMTYDNPGVSFNTGDTFYYSPYAFESAGATLTVTKEIDERYVSGGAQPHSFKFKTSYDDAALSYKLQMKEYTTADSGQVLGTTVTLTDVEEL